LAQEMPFSQRPQEPTIEPIHKRAKARSIKIDSQHGKALKNEEHCG